MTSFPLGIFLGYRVFLDFLTTADAFIIRWNKILITMSVASFAAMAVTISPALRAARFPPAEALRFAE